MSAVPPLARALKDGDPIVRGHAAWALGRLEPGGQALRAAFERETDRTVLAEIESALDR